MQQLQEIYCRYTEVLGAAHKSAAPLAGVFGLSGGVKDHPSHQEFYSSVGRWVEDFLSGDPEQAQIAEATRMILIAGAAHKKEPTYWFCFAAQAHTKAMIPLLSQEDCLALCREYDELYPIADRMPVNQEIYSLLRAQAGLAAQGKRRFGFLRR